MQNEKDIIEKLYSEKLGNFQPDTSDDEWNTLNLKLGRNNFLKFSITTLNIYYLGVLLSFAGAFSYSAYNNHVKTATIKELQEKINALTPPEVKIETLDTIHPETTDTSALMMPPATCKTTARIFCKEKDSVSPEKINNPQTTVLKTDTIAKPQIINTNKPDSVVVSENKLVVKRIKKTVFVKKDTIILKDTLKIKKNNSSKKNRK